LGKQPWEELPQGGKRVRGQRGMRRWSERRGREGLRGLFPESTNLKKKGKGTVNLDIVRKSRERTAGEDP